MLLPYRTSWPFRGIATLLFMLWCLPFAAPWMPKVVDCVMTQPMKGSGSAQSTSAAHSPDCHCIHCMGGKNGKSCCCVKGRTATERLAFSAVCDTENPITTVGAVAKITIFSATVALHIPTADAREAVPADSASQNCGSLFPAPLNQPPRLS